MDNGFIISPLKNFPSAPWIWSATLEIFLLSLVAVVADVFETSTSLDRTELLFAKLFVVDELVV